MSSGITAAITTYKREWPLIERAIKSMEAQSLLPDEILLVDDNHPGSEFSDMLKEEAKKHPLVKYLSAGKNCGVSGARNYAILHASGDYIAFLDDDDEWFPKKLERLKAAFDANPEAGLAFSKGFKRIEGAFGNTVDAPTWSSSIFKEHPDYKDMLAGDHVGTASNPMIRLKALQTVGNFRTLQQPAVEDYELWTRIAMTYPLIGVDEYLFLKHMPDGDHVSTNHERVFLGYKKIYEVNKDAYDADRALKEKIFYNMARQAIKGKYLKGMPAVLEWMWLKVTARR